MAKIDNSGYILVDFSKVDHNKHSQVIDGFYADCEKLISNEKFVLLCNVNEVSTTPIPSIVLFKNSIYNVITFEYVYTISAGDVVVVTKNEGGITVDVIDDSIIALNKTWSSSKINEMLPDNAGQIVYDNTVSHLQSNRVQSAIDELVTIVNGIDSRVVVTESDISTIKNQLITIANEISLLHNAANIEVSSGVSVTDVLTSLDNNKQDVLTAGNNISISSNSVISAVDTTYTAGNNVSISSDNVISATDTVYGAGDGIDITNNVISFDKSTAGLIADDIEYSSGVSVADKIDDMATVKNVSSSVTKYTNIDYFEKSVVRSGNVVCVYISFSFSSTPTANNIIAENLPKAAANMLLLCECTSGSNNGKAARVMVNSMGRVLDWYTTGFFGTGMNYSIIGSYITNDPI